MTLFIAFIATVNIAFGYGLAVYMGHGQLPWAFGRLTLPRFGSKTSDAIDHVPAEDADEKQTSPQVVATKPVEAAPPSEPKVDRVVVKEEKPEPVAEPVTQVTEVAEAPSEIPASETEPAVAAKTIVPAEAQVEPQTVEPELVVPQEVADSETSTAEVADSPPTEGEEKVEVEAVEATTETKEQPAAVADEPAAVADKVDEKFLEGIAAFQSQLEKQVDEPASDSESETAQDAAAPANTQELSEEQTPSEAEDVLAGIESFRAQLATMQQDPETAAEEPAAQPAS